MGTSSRDINSNVRRDNAQSESQQNTSTAPEYTSQQKEAVDKYVCVVCASNWSYVITNHYNGIPKPYAPNVPQLKAVFIIFIY